MGMEYTIGQMDMFIREISLTIKGVEKGNYSIIIKQFIKAFGSTDKDVMKTIIKLLIRM